uniref:CUB domain-containing protein n=1 Tax=Takifugu rubripes TaxID=31033 RepID=A0A674MJW2_TAKRU
QKKSCKTEHCVFLLGACGGIVTTGDTPRFLFSPGWPENYPPNLECSWLIRSEDSIVELNLLSLDIENYPMCCTADYVLNGLADDAPRLQRFCGTVAEGTQVHSSGNTMAIVFYTDASISNGGFMASYSSEEPAGKNCGGVLNRPAGGNFSSPGYLVSNYSHNLNCEWLIENPQTMMLIVLQLTFSYFNLEPHSTCTWDSVTIFNGGSPGSPVIGQYCGTSSPGSIQSGSNKLAVVFLADHSLLSCERLFRDHFNQALCISITS